MAVKIDGRIAQLSLSQNPEEIKKNLVGELPRELALKVLSHLDLSSLGACLLVSKGWNQLASDQVLLKTAIYKELAFSSDKWAQCFGGDVVAGEDREEEFASLPVDIAEEYRRFQRVFPEQNARDSLMLVRLPKSLNGGLTIRSIGELARLYFPEKPMGYSHVSQPIFDELGDRPIDRSRWVIMIKGNDGGFLEESRNRTYAGHVRIVANLAEDGLIGYEIPDTLAAITCIFAKYFSSGVRLFTHREFAYIHCQDNIQGYQVCVGGFFSGLWVGSGYHDHHVVGVTALRKF